MNILVDARLLSVSIPRKTKTIRIKRGFPNQGGAALGHKGLVGVEYEIIEKAWFSNPGKEAAHQTIILMVRPV